MKVFVLALALSMPLLAACSGGADEVATESTAPAAPAADAAAAQPPAAAPTAPEPAPAAGAPRGGFGPHPPRADAGAGAEAGTGVAECDTFLARYEACLARVPEEAQGGMQTALASWKGTWQTMSRSPTTRGNLAAICTRTAENAMASLDQYDCPR